MQLAGLDWAIIVGFFIFWLILGSIVGRRAGDSTEEFFLAGRRMPWWLLGFSLVATTFAADTPLFVSGLVRQRGVAGNWNWWAFLLNGMLTVFVFAKLWHRSGLHTDLEFYELRVQRQAGRLFAWISRHLLGDVLQHHDHGRRDPGRDQTSRECSWASIPGRRLLSPV